MSDAPTGKRSAAASRGAAPALVVGLVLAGVLLVAAAVLLGASLAPTGAEARGSGTRVQTPRGLRVVGHLPGGSRIDVRPPQGSATGLQSQRELPYHPYDGTWTFVRIRTRSGARLGRLARYAGWAHDYPDAERNFTRIVEELTTVRTTRVSSGGNVLTFEDPRLGRFPLAYVSEPDEWRTTAAEADALREYLQKGGFVIFDDFYEREMENLVRQMARVFPDLRFLPLDGSEPIWSSFFSLEPTRIVLEGPRKSGTPQFYGLYEGNDKSGRMLAVAAAGADIGDLWEWSDEGYYPLDPTNEAYRIGINFLVYAFTH